MVNPTGYTALDLVGFSDKGAYSSAATYVKNDLAHYAGNVWRCLLDDTTAITPAEGLNWTIFIAEPSNAVESSIAPIETSPAEADHAQGSQLYFNDTLYKAKTAIAIGDALVVGTNIELADKITVQLAQKANTSSLANVATSGSYSDLSNKPTLGTAAAKDTTNAVTQNDTDPVESGAVYTSVNAVNSRVNDVSEEIAPIENGPVASQSYVLGEQFSRNDILCRATTDIAQGATLVLDTNYEVADNVTHQLTSLKEALTNLTEITTYQRALSMPQSGSFLDFVAANCIHTGLYTVDVGDVTNITDLPSGNYGAYSTSYVLSRSGVKQVFLTTYNSYVIWMNTAVNNNWSGWKKLSTDIELPTQRVAITGASEYYTIEQNAQYIESYYYKRYGMCFVGISVKCVTPRQYNADIASLPGADKFTTIYTMLVNYDDGSVMPMVFQAGHLYVKGGVAGKLYGGTFCYPIA